MFVGHLGVALGTKAVAPKVPLGSLVAAAFFLDLVWPVLLLVGVEQVRIDPGNTAFTPLAFTYYPFSHSLMMAWVWGILVGLFAAWRGLGPLAGLVLCGTVISHWILDLITHRPDLPLRPDGPSFGLGLWNSIAGTIGVEGLLFGAAVWLYARRSTPSDGIGRWALWTLVGLVTAIWLSGPWSPPPPSELAVALVGLSMWLFPVWAGWIERHRPSVDSTRDAGSSDAIADVNAARRTR
ncbi:MAG: hypothetical protein U0Q12_17360 [Vicinamibacterales bacterium]